MFGSLFGKKKQKAHPVSTEAGLDDLLQEMSCDAAGFLGAVDDWLDDIPSWSLKLAWKPVFAPRFDLTSGPDSVFQACCAII